MNWYKHSQITDTLQEVDLDTGSIDFPPIDDDNDGDEGNGDDGFSDSEKLILTNFMYEFLRKQPEIIEEIKNEMFRKFKDEKLDGNMSKRIIVPKNIQAGQSPNSNQPCAVLEGFVEVSAKDVDFDEDTFFSPYLQSGAFVYLRDKMFNAITKIPDLNDVNFIDRYNLTIYNWLSMGDMQEILVDSIKALFFTINRSEFLITYIKDVSFDLNKNKENYKEILKQVIDYLSNLTYSEDTLPIITEILIDLDLDDLYLSEPEYERRFDEKYEKYQTEVVKHDMNFDLGKMEILPHRTSNPFVLFQANQAMSLNNPALSGNLQLNAKLSKRFLVYVPIVKTYNPGEINET
jgi:hypothetical protein